MSIYLVLPLLHDDDVDDDDDVVHTHTVHTKKPSSFLSDGLDICIATYL